MAIIERVSKHKGKRYKVRLQDKLGNWHPIKVFSSRSEAKEYEQRLMGKNSNNEVAQDRGLRYLKTSQYFEMWLDRGTSKASQGWRRVQVQMLRDHVLPYIGNVNLVEVRSLHIGTLLNALERKDLSKQTCLHVYSLLHKAFDDAIHNFEFIDRNPVIKRLKPRLIKSEQSFLTPDQSKKLLEASKYHFTGPAIWLGVFCGLRFGEIAALKVCDLDFAKKQILIRAAFKARMNRVEPFPKEGRWKYIPMPQPLLEYLKMRVEGRSSEGLVVTGRYGGMLNLHVFSSHLLRFCRMVEIPEVSSHNLRHSCTEIWISQGASVEDIRRLLNHTDPKTTLRYIHRTDERLLKISDRLANFGTG